MRRHLKHLSAIALVVGFIIDSLTLRRVDLLAENLALITYILVIGVCVVLANFRNRPWVMYVMQFAIGGLFSAFLIFYSRSASILSSWPFLLILLGQMIANEVLADKYDRLVLQIGIFFFSIFSYLIFVLPIVLGHIGNGVFLLSGLASLVLIYLFIILLGKFTAKPDLRDYRSTARREIRYTVLGVYFLINVLYFTNIIPPIPLSLQEIGVYNSVSRRSDGSYALVRSTERPRFWDLGGDEISVDPGKPVYVFSAVFAPTKIDTDIVHEWLWFDEVTDRWTVASKVRFPIVGGRADGYRGYSFVNNPKPGDWKVKVETTGGKVIGTIKFEII